MASRNVVLQILIGAKDTASSILLGVIKTAKLLDSEMSVIAGKLRSSFSNAFLGGLEGSKEFELQLDKVQAKGDYTAESMEELKKQAISIGADFKIGGTEAAKGMEALAAAGLNATEVTQALPSVLTLAKSEQISMNVAAEKLSDSLAIVGLGFEKTGDMANKLAKGANISTTSAIALAEALANAGGIAKTAGLDLDQTVGVLTTLAQAGIKGEKAGTSLAATLTNLTNPASKASEELSNLGITSRDLITVIGQLAEKGDASNSAILAFGETAGPGLRALLRKGEEGINDFVGQLANSDDAAKKAADQISGNLDGAINAIKTSWENIKNALAEPVIEPLTKNINELAKAINDTLNDGSLKPAQEAIKSFAINSIEGIKAFVASFDFKSAGTAINEFATNSVIAFESLGKAGSNVAQVLIVGWNGLTGTIRLLGSTLLAIAASAVQTLANAELLASKIGLGTQQKANELQQTANKLQATSSELFNNAKKDGQELAVAYDKLTSSVDSTTNSVKNLNDNLKPAELEEVKRSFKDYLAIAEKADEQVKQAKEDYWAGKISLEEFAKAGEWATIANADVANSMMLAANETKNLANSSNTAKISLEAQATDTQKIADKQNDYVSALESTGNAQASAIRAEIALANAKGDGYTAALKSIELAKLEADISKKVADAKVLAANAAKVAVAAQEKYLQSIGGGTEIQKADLEIQKARTAALLAESVEATADAEIKNLLITKVTELASSRKKDTEEIRSNTEAVKESTDAGEQQRKVYTLMEDAATGMIRQLSGVSAGMNELLSAMTRSQDIGATFGHQYRSELGKLQLQLKNVNQVIEHNTSIVGTNADAYEKNANHVNKAFKMLLEQQIAALKLAGTIDELTQSENVNIRALEGIVAQAENAKRGFKLLDQETLDKLSSQIDKAKDKITALKDAARAARNEVANIQADILEEQGNTVEAEKLRQRIAYTEKLADLEEKKRKADIEGNAELSRSYAEAIKELEILNNLKLKNINTKSNNNSGGSTSSSGGGGIATTGGNTFIINANKARVLDKNFIKDVSDEIDNLNRRKT